MAGALYNPRTLVDTGKTLTLNPVIKSTWYNKLVDPVLKVVTYIPVATYSYSRRWATQKGRGDRGQREEDDI